MSQEEKKQKSSSTRSHRILQEDTLVTLTGQTQCWTFVYNSLISVSALCSSLQSRLDAKKWKKAYFLTCLDGDRTPWERRNLYERNIMWTAIRAHWKANSQHNSLPTTTLNVEHTNAVRLMLLRSLSLLRPNTLWAVLTVLDICPMQCTHILYHMNLLVSYRNPQDTDTQALPACGCFLHIHWWVEGVCCSCVCVCTDGVNCKSFWETNHRCSERCMRTCCFRSLSLFLFSVSATCRPPLAHPPHTAHHLFLGTMMSSYIWRSSGALHGGASGCCCLLSLLGSWGEWTVYTSCSTSHTFSVFFMFICFLRRLKSRQLLLRRFNGSNGPSGWDG